MARKPLRPRKAAVKAAADRAEARAAGKPIDDEPKAKVDPEIVIAEEIEKRRKKMGRPTKYDPSMCEQIIEYGLQGMGKAEMAAEFMVARNTLENWADQHPEFLNAYTRAQELSLAWWQAQGRRGIWAGKEFNANAYAFQAKNRFPKEFQDLSKQEVTGKDGGPVEVESNKMQQARRVAYAMGLAIGRAQAAKAKAKASA